MSPEQATALRKPFPPESIGQLPKPYKKESPKGDCRECGGYHGLPAVHLDYAGHAAVTDRLLTVDPEWSWRPFTSEEIIALPPTLRDAGLWIHLTVCGVERPGVGDGSSAKECIGDAIRNAAMRFGVALDLWAKENLVEFAQAARRAAPQGSPAAPPDDYRATAAGEPDDYTATTVDDLPPVAPPIEPESPLLNTSSKLAKAMYAGIHEAGIEEADRIAWVGNVIGRDIASTKEMTDDEARVVLALLDERKAKANAQPEKIEAPA